VRCINDFSCTNSPPSNHASRSSIGRHLKTPVYQSVLAELPDIWALFLFLVDTAFLYSLSKKLKLIKSPPDRTVSIPMCSRATPKTNVVDVVSMSKIMTMRINGIKIIPPPGAMS
jgi:hypothetical protein